MPKLRTTFHVLLLITFLPAYHVFADSFPCYSVDRMCDMTELIIKGESIGDNKVRIDRLYKKPAGWDEACTEITVEDLDKHSRKLNSLFNKTTADEIKTKNLVLFLKHKPEDENNIWRSLYTITEAKLTGSCGLYWIDEKNCYGYDQQMNPGPYVLSKGSDSNYRIPANEAALDEDIEIGLKNSERWRAVLALEDPKKKAEALSKYILKRTSPEGDKGTYKYYVREPMRELGGHAVPALIDVIKSAEPGERINIAVLILYDIGPEAVKAVPVLCGLLDEEKEDMASPGYVISALRTIHDKRAIPMIRDMLDHKRFGVAVKAAVALAEFEDHNSFDVISALIPSPDEKKRTSDTRDLLNALYSLDPVKAKPIIEKVAEREDLADVRDQIKGLDD